MNNLKAFIVYHPGETLLDELDERGISQSDFAKIIDRPLNAVNAIIKGKKAITPETANSIAVALDTSPELWLNMQTQYDLYSLSQEEDNREVIRKRAKLYSLIPVRELIKRGRIKAEENIDILIKKITYSLGIKSLNDFENQVAVESTYVHFRKSDHGETNRNFLYTWRKIGEVEAKKIKCSDFNKQELIEFAKRIKKYSSEDKEIEKIVMALRKIGVRLIFLEHFPRTKVDGAVFWFEKKPVILMSFRYDRIDNFYFTLLHEIGHIILHKNESFYDDTKVVDETKNKQCTQVDDFAQEHLVPRSVRIKIGKGTITSKVLYDKSDELGIHPGLLIGALQHDGVLKYSQFRKGLVKIKHTIPANMMVN